MRGVALGTLRDRVRDPLNSRSENSCSSAIAFASPFAALHNWGLFWEVSQGPRVRRGPWLGACRSLCYKCNGRRTAAGVISRGVPDPRRHDQDRPESDSDDSAALDVRQEEIQDEWEALQPLLRSKRSTRGPGSKKRDNPYGGTHGGRSKGKYSRGRGTRGGAAAWLSAGVVASTYRGTGLVRGPVPLRLPPRPFGRAAPLRFAGVRRDHFGYVFEPVRAATSYTWAFARRVMNRIAHICTGNISAWAGVAAALAAPVLLSVQRGSVPGWRLLRRSRPLCPGEGQIAGQSVPQSVLVRRAARPGGARGGVRARSGMQLGRRRIAMRQDQASVAIAETRGRRRGERPSRGGSLRARCVRGGRPRRDSGSGPERAAPLEGSAGRQRDGCRPYRRQFELVDEFQGQRRDRTAPDGRLGSPSSCGFHSRL